MQEDCRLAVVVGAFEFADAAHDDLKQTSSTLAVCACKYKLTLLNELGREMQQVQRAGKVTGLSSATACISCCSKRA